LQALKICKELDLTANSNAEKQQVADIADLFAKGRETEGVQKAVQMAVLFHTVQRCQSISR
jgi:hypothetical protein